MHESIAKAELKGAFRKANFRVENLNKYVVDLDESSLYSKKSITRINQYIVEACSDLLFYYKKTKNRISWHFKCELVSIRPVFYNCENVGKICPIIFEIFNTNKLKSNKDAHYQVLTCFFLHEHFLIRLFQRTEFGSISEIGPLLIRIIYWITNKRRSLSDYGNHIHIVLKERVFICSVLDNLTGLVFKTVLLTERFTLTQTKRYKLYHDLLIESNSKAICYCPDINEHFHIEEVKNIDLLDLISKHPEWHDLI